MPQGKPTCLDLLTADGSSTPAVEAPAFSSIDGWKAPPQAGTHSDYGYSAAIEDPLAFHPHSQPTSIPHISNLILSRPPPPSPSGSSMTSSSFSGDSYTHSSPQPMHLPHDPLYFDARATGFWPKPPPHSHMPMPMPGQMPGSVPMGMPMPMPMPMQMHPGYASPPYGVGLGLFIPNPPPANCGPEPVSRSSHTLLES